MRFSNILPSPTSSFKMQCDQEFWWTQNIYSLYLYLTKKWYCILLLLLWDFVLIVQLKRWRKKQQHAMDFVSELSLSLPSLSFALHQNKVWSPSYFHMFTCSHKNQAHAGRITDFRKVLLSHGHHRGPRYKFERRKHNGLPNLKAPATTWSAD